MTSGLRVEAVSVVRGGRTLFSNRAFRLAPGEAALVTGANGAGKSSLLRALAGLLPATGTIALVADPAISWRMPLALMAEASALDGDRTLYDALLFWARLGGAQAAIRVDAALEAVGLSALAGVPVRLLSTGQRRRATFARVVASQARLWLLDEPANGLDTPAIATLETLIAGHRHAGGIVVVATHQPIALPDAVTVAL